LGFLRNYGLRAREEIKEKYATIIIINSMKEGTMLGLRRRIFYNISRPSDEKGFSLRSVKRREGVFSPSLKNGTYNYFMLHKEI
jgi:hypothetical protein